MVTTYLFYRQSNQGDWRRIRAREKVVRGRTIFEIFGIIQAIGNDVIIIINHRYQVVEGLREELSQARVSNNQLLEALEVTDQLMISCKATIQKLPISFFGVFNNELADAL